MGAADRRQIIAFDKRGVGSNVGGKKPGDWEFQCQEFARETFLRGPDTIIAQRQRGVNTVILTVPSSSATRLITAGWRARNLRSGVTYNIRSVTPNERLFQLDLMCEVGVPDG